MNAPLANEVVESQPQKSVHDLFAGLGGGNSSVAQHVPPPPSTSAPALEPPPQTGIALLKSIFASALPSGPSSAVIAQPTQPLPSQPEEIVIVSPKPTSSALPQILNQDVISSLLGLNSRASSAAPSSVGSRRSGQQRYEGDNELSEGDQTSDGEPRRYNVYSDARLTNGIPTVTVPQTPDSDSEGVGSANGSRRVPGDVTPRPPAGGVKLPLTSLPQFQHAVTPNFNGNGKAPAPANGAVAPSPAPSRQRPLVPFEANSDLWPYPRAPLDDRLYENDEVVELDFSDTRALSDPTIFSSRLKEKKEKKDKGKKSRKERERNKEREQAEIEKGWDLPTQAQVQPPYQAAATGPVAEAAKPKAISAAVNGAAVNGAAAVRPSQNGTLNGTAAKEAILGALLTKVPAQAAIGRNDFVRELLNLIHVSPSFSSMLIHVR